MTSMPIGRCPWAVNARRLAAVAEGRGRTSSQRHEQGGQRKSSSACRKTAEQNITTAQWHCTVFHRSVDSTAESQSRGQSREQDREQCRLHPLMDDAAIKCYQFNLTRRALVELLSVRLSVSIHSFLVLHFLSFLKFSYLSTP